MSTNVSILTEIPEELYCSIRAYLDDHPTWDQDRVFTTALSLFFLRDNRQPPATEYDRCARVYLETLYQQTP